MRFANGRAPRTNPRNPTDAKAAFSVVPVFGSTFKPSSFAAGLSAGLSAGLAESFLFNGYSGLSRTAGSVPFTPPLKSETLLTGASFGNSNFTFGFSVRGPLSTTGASFGASP